MNPKIELPVPCQEEMERWLNQWDLLPDYTEQEKSLDRLFKDDAVMRLNTDISAVLLKCAVLNDFYSTNIYKVYLVARHILQVEDVDKRLSEGDLGLVEEIADVGAVELNGRTIEVPRVYSFATKFCSHHNEVAFPIYDSYVHQLLHHYNSRLDTHFTDEPTHANLRKGDGTHVPMVRDYSCFVRCVSDFKNHFGLETCNGFKDLDRYLWQLGKAAFPKSYGKKKEAKGL